jgi:NAD(P)H-dependent FMN reductase
LLRTVQLVAPEGVETVLYQGLDGLPHFDPDRDRAPLHPSVADLRANIHACDAILFCTPEYAGALPGSFKNLLDWTIGDDHLRSIYEKPVAWVNASALPSGAADAHESLAKVLSYAHAAVVKDACVSIPVTHLGPTMCEHINVHGRYHFSLGQPPKSLRPLTPLMKTTPT